MLTKKQKTFNWILAVVLDTDGRTSDRIIVVPVPGYLDAGKLIQTRRGNHC